METLVILLCVGGFVTALTIPFWYPLLIKEHDKARKLPKIKFTDFRSWFWLNPSEYILNNSTIHRYGLGDFRFGFIDTICYKIWKWQYQQNKKKKEKKDQVYLLLSYVKRDIEAYEKQTEKEMKKVGRVFEQSYGTRKD